MLTQVSEEELFTAFSQEVKRAFSFLERLGYELVEAYPFTLEYRSERGFVLVWLNPQPGHELYNVDVVVGPARLAIDESRRLIEGSDLFDLAYEHLAGATREELRPYDRLSFPANHRRDYRDQLRESVERLARTLEDEFPHVLRDEDGILERLAADRAREEEKGLAELELSWTRPDAREAFDRRDWERVIALYHPLKAHLKRHELMRLDYAKRKLREGA